MTLLRLRLIGWGTSRRRTWEYHRGSYGQGGSVSEGALGGQLGCFALRLCGTVRIAFPTLPLRSRKKIADAMAGGCVCCCRGNSSVESCRRRRRVKEMLLTETEEEGHWKYKGASYD